MNNTFKKEVLEGLSKSQKTLPSKYFYDQTGDALFVKIMNMPEYYLTRSELDIFTNKTAALIDSFGVQQDTYFELIELGAGDGLKTKALLKELLAKKYNFDYFPIDISSNALNLLEENLQEEIPDLSVKTQAGDYFEVLGSLNKSKHPKVILFLGSNIGNMRDEQAANFLKDLSAVMQKGDKMLLGVDLKKPREIVLPAYNDKQGITAAFNLNILHRINNELGGDFNVEQFKHSPEYDEEEGIAKSYIESTADQTVTIKALDSTFHFAKNEKIHTEISRKYNDAILEKIVQKSKFEVEQKVMDSKAYFADYILGIN